MTPGPVRTRRSAVQQMMWGSRQGMRFFVRRVMPSSRRCKVCWVPSQGPFSVPFQIFQIRPSRKTPRLHHVIRVLSPGRGDGQPLGAVR